MSDKLTIVLNGQAVVEYDRNKPLAEGQYSYLDRMDAEMDKGLEIGGERIEHPELNHRAQFVALQLFHALSTNNDAIIAASCAYLALRLPELKQVVGKNIEGQAGVAVDLVFDKPHVKEATLQFMKPH